MGNALQRLKMLYNVTRNSKTLFKALLLKQHHPENSTHQPLPRHSFYRRPNMVKPHRQMHKKANSSLGFIKRNLRHCPKSCRRNAYLSLIRPILEYGAIVWDPHLKKDIDKLERVQRSAARFIAGDFRTTTPGFVTKILDQNQLPTLQSRREDLRLTFFHKIVQGLVPAIPPQTFLTPQQTGRLRRTTRDQNFSYQSTDNNIRNNKKCFKVPQSKTNQFKFSFLPRTTISWNSLPDTVVEHQTTEGFKGALARQRK